MKPGPIDLPVEFKPQPINSYRRIEGRKNDLPSTFETVSSGELCDLADNMLLGDIESRNFCVEFLLLDRLPYYST